MVNRDEKKYSRVRNGVETTKDVHTDRLTAFHAEPLVYKDKRGTVKPFSQLNHEYEKHLLLHALNDAERTVGAKIDVDFDVATMDRLEDFLTRDTSSVMHFSCHGNRQYLAVENNHEWGVLQPLMVDRLKTFITSGQRNECNLKVVFVSACQSENAGEAFHAAGVPHVICCRGGTTSSNGNISQTAAAIFARSFYRSLAYGKTLKESFNVAKQAVLHAPSVKDPHEQVTKFLLLPEKPKDDPYHDIRVFFIPNGELSKRVPLLGHQEHRLTRKMLPPPPRTSSSGHRVRMYHLLEEIHKNRLTKITEDNCEFLAHVGKHHGGVSVAKAVCHHIRERSLAFLIDDVCWVKPRGNTLCNDTVSVCFQKILRTILKNGNNPRRTTVSPKFTCWYTKLITALHTSHAIVFVDVTAAVNTTRRSSIDESTLKKLDCLLQLIVSETQNVRFVLVSPTPTPVTSPEDSVVITVDDSDDEDTLLEMAELIISDDSDGELDTPGIFGKRQELSKKIRKLRTRFRGF